MKRKYTAPALAVLRTEAQPFCAPSAWHVDHDDSQKHPTSPTEDFGPILIDQGLDSWKGHEKDDPWNSDNW